MWHARPTPDLLLARRAARADPDAWDELIQRYGARIYNLALRFAGNPAEAEDLTQEVFLKLFRHLDRYRGDVPLVGWALRLSRNLCIDHWRASRARPLSDAVSETVLVHIADADDPQRRILARDQLRHVHDTLGELSEDLAITFALRELHSMSYDDIATFLDVPVGTVKSRLSRARRELFKRLDTTLGTAAVGAVS
ncbi:MAG: RNA polymerase sigma factor [Acidobacteriota bacterium]